MSPRATRMGSNPGEGQCWQNYLKRGKPGLRKSRQDPHREVEADVEYILSILGAVLPRNEVPADRNNARAKSILKGSNDHVTTDHVRSRTWLPAEQPRYHHQAGERSGTGSVARRVTIAPVMAADLKRLRPSARRSPTRPFLSLIAPALLLSSGLALTQVASFDDDFAIYRYGRNRDRAFEVLR